MNIHTIDKYNFENIDLEKPEKDERINAYTTILNIYFQTPKLNILKVTTNKLTIELNDEFVELLTKFDENIIKLISEKSENGDYFENKFSLEEVEDIYKSSFKFNGSKINAKMNINLSDDVTVFNKEKKVLNKGDLKEDDNVILLLKCSNIVFYKTHCAPYWEALQIKIKEKPKEKKINYMFLDDEVEENKTKIKNLI